MKNLFKKAAAFVCAAGLLLTSGSAVYADDWETTVLKPQRIKQVSVGEYHSAAVTTNGDLYTWGYNGSGQLGDGTTEERYVPKKIMSDVAYVSLGYDHSAAVTTSGDLYTWGSNYYGQLGNGRSGGDKYSYDEGIDSSIPIKVMENVASVSLDYHMNAAITKTHYLYVWGEYNINGDPITAPQEVTGISNVASVSLGRSHKAAITKDAKLYVWGSPDASGELGVGKGFKKPTLSNVASVSLGYEFSAAITRDGDLYTWGNNQYGQLGNGTTGGSSTVNREPKLIMSDVASVSLGFEHSAAVTKNGELYTWGLNSGGRLGDGTKNNSNVPIKIMDNVASVSLGEYNGAAVTKNGDLYAWGINADGQLGSGTDNSSSVPKKILICENFIYDINEDGEVDGADSVCVLKALTKNVPDPSEYYDLNGDGLFDIRDLSKIIYYCNEC